MLVSSNQGSLRGQEALSAVLSSTTGSLSASSSSSSSTLPKWLAGSAGPQPQPAQSCSQCGTVLQLLQCWQQCPDVLLSQSRSSWLRRVTKTGAYIGGLKRKQGRLAVARYVFTAVCGAYQPGVGPVCSCCCVACTQ